MHHPTALARRRVREVSSPRRRGVRRRVPNSHLEINMLALIEPLPLPDDDAGGVPVANGDI